MFRAHGRLHPGCREFTLGDDRVPGLAFQANLPRPGSAMPFVFWASPPYNIYTASRPQGSIKLKPSTAPGLTNKQTNNKWNPNFLIKKKRVLADQVLLLPSVLGAVRVFMVSKVLFDE